MSLGKDSITKRVAKPAQEKKAAPAAKKAPAKKPAVKKETTAAVLTNVAPETVEKVIGRAETAAVVKVALGEKMPYYLL